MEPRVVYLPLMWACVILFMFRVLGQVYVALYTPRWLPPMREWYSGLLPYYLLLPAQLLIFAFMTIVGYDYSRETGYFFVTSSIKGKLLMGLAIAYFSSMVIRYAATMVRSPERRWLGGIIPIAFHCVLAAFIFMAGSFRLF